VKAGTIGLLALGAIAVVAAIGVNEANATSETYRGIACSYSNVSGTWSGSATVAGNALPLYASANSLASAKTALHAQVDAALTAMGYAAGAPYSP
jgi:hypothetical protein